MVTKNIPDDELIRAILIYGVCSWHIYQLGINNQQDNWKHQLRETISYVVSKNGGKKYGINCVVCQKEMLIEEAIKQDRDTHYEPRID